MRILPGDQISVDFELYGKNNHYCLTDILNNAEIVAKNINQQVLKYKLCSFEQGMLRGHFGNNCFTSDNFLAYLYLYLKRKW